MPAELLTASEQRATTPATAPIEDAELRAARKRQARRAGRLKLHAAAWGLGTILLTAAWIVHEWLANGSFARFAHEGNTGDWNPTLWAVAILVWGLVVGIMALRVYFERPATAAEIDREAGRLQHRGSSGPAASSSSSRCRCTSTDGTRGADEEKGLIDMERFRGKYLSLTSFRRDGSGVATPVWFVADDGRLVVETDADSYKVKRIHRDPHVRIAVCDARGRLRGEAVDAEATVLPDSERERVERLLARKYRIDRFTVLPLYRLVMRLRGRGSRTQQHPVAIAIAPIDKGKAGAR